MGNIYFMNKKSVKIEDEREKERVRRDIKSTWDESVVSEK